MIYKVFFLLKTSLDCKMESFQFKDKNGEKLWFEISNI